MLKFNLEEKEITLVVACYNEDLSWFQMVPKAIRIVVYNKGECAAVDSLPGNVERIETRRNFGRESETYLHHLLHGGRDKVGHTIFCQGNPFEHSPDFLKLLDHRDQWRDIQPLTVQWLEARQIPPVQLIARERREFIHGCRVRTELYSLHTWNALRFVDDGASRIGRDYLSGHGLPAGTNIAAHFLRSAGWEQMAVDAETADFGQFCYGAIFAVRNHLLSRIPEEVLKNFQVMTRSSPIHGYIFERLWLHFFGLPFHPAVVRHRT